MLVLRRARLGLSFTVNELPGDTLLFRGSTQVQAAVHAADVDIVNQDHIQGVGGAVLVVVLTASRPQIRSQDF